MDEGKKLMLILLFVSAVLILLLLAGCSVRGDCEGPFRAACVQVVRAISKIAPCDGPYEARRVEHRVEIEHYDSQTLMELRNGEWLPVRMWAPRGRTVVEQDCGR